MQNNGDGLLFGREIPMARLLGVQGRSLQDDQAVLVLPFRADIANSRGEVSGGAIATALDLALAACVRAHDPQSYTVSTAELTTHFIASGGGDLTMKARCTHLGSRICFAQGETFDAAGKLVATASGVFVLLRKA